MSGLPKTRPRLTGADWLIEFIGALGIIALIGLPILMFNSLPDEIPIHFGIDGKPTSYSNKYSVFILPIIGLMLYVGLQILNRYPYIFNYPQKVTETNAERQYTLATRLIRLINAIIALSFGYIKFSTIQTGIGSKAGLSPLFMFVFLFVIFGILIVFVVKLVKD